MKTKFTVTNVLTQGFADQQVTLENETACVTIRLKDQGDFNQFSKGQTVSLSIGAPKKETEPAQDEKKTTKGKKTK